MADPVITPGNRESSRRTAESQQTDYNTRIDADSTASLLRRLMDGVSTLFRKELALARSEISEAAAEAKKGAISIASGGLVLFAGFIILLLAIVYALAQFMSFWLAALIVGAVVMVIGFIMVQGGKKKLEPVSFKPERTAASLEKDKEALQGRST
jgi:uncharacterized membrane protein YqjE